jgi:hypothetical protein
VRNQKLLPVTSSHLCGVAGVLRADGQLTNLRDVETFERDLFATLGTCYGLAQMKDGTPLVLIPEAQARFTGAADSSRFSKGSCEFQAIKAYVQNLFGITLSSEDADWFQRHPLVEAEGTPMAHTLTVAQQLVLPYDLRISRVRVMQNVSLPGELAEWPHVLGVNPFGMANGFTSNVDFAQETGLPLAEVMRLFRFEFSEVPLTPAVVCGIHAFDGHGKHGHASYVAPRGVRPNTLHVVQFQLDRSVHVSWLREPDLQEPQLEVEQYAHQTERLSLYFSLGPDKVEIYKKLPTKTVPSESLWDSDKRFESYGDKGMYGASGEGTFDDMGGWTGYTYGGAGEGTPGDVRPARAKAKAKKGKVGTFLQQVMPHGLRDRECYACGTVDHDGPLAAPHVCLGCWNSLWDGYQCNYPGCTSVFRTDPPVFERVYADGKRRYIHGSCFRCKKLYSLEVGPDKPLTEMIRDAVHGQRASRKDQQIAQLYTQKMLEL